MGSMIKQQIISELKKVLSELGIEDIKPAVEYAKEAKFGDYSSNIALIAGKKIARLQSPERSDGGQGKNPMTLAEDLKAKIDLELIEKIDVATPGFINFWVKDEALFQSLSSEDTKLKTSFSGKRVMVEFAHPNTHKAFHIGHLRNITTGESIIRLFEESGVKVIRVNYQGDVGMHIAKALFGLLQISDLKSEISNLNDVRKRVSFLGKAYASGSKAFEEDEVARKEITEINKKIYARDTSIWELYQTTRQWSLDYFEEIYSRVDSKFERYYFESEVYESGKKTVLEGLKKGIFEESKGAIIFPGGKFALHDRVFITGEGNPTYEGKEMGLGRLQFDEYHPDQIIHVVGPEQAGYFKVVFEALSQLFPETKGKEYHLAYGWVKLKEGKMSSRTGNVVLGEWLLDSAKEKIKQEHPDIKDEVAEEVGVGAVKYSFLKVSTGQEIAFDLEESISFDGNSGPYLQYTYARTQSVLAKGGDSDPQFKSSSYQLEPEERDLLKLLARFPEIVAEAAERLAPNVLCTYLFELAQNFNLFYQKHQIIKAEEEAKKFRLGITKATGETIKKGLHLLGIKAPDKM